MVNEDASIIVSGNSKSNLEGNRLLGLRLGKIHWLVMRLDVELIECPMAAKSAIGSIPNISFTGGRKVSKCSPIVSPSASKNVRGRFSQTNITIPDSLKSRSIAEGDTIENILNYSRIVCHCPKPPVSLKSIIVWCRKCVGEN